ncbi:hypothetical protein MMC28_011436 [Mycoblastus sanguinarius]|nr:hypothetical protein [Mycoblastus sanguinarius]
MALKMSTTFAEATSIRAIDDQHYTAFFHPDWCVGSGRLPLLIFRVWSNPHLTVPHGGYVASCFLSVARLHFQTTLRSQDQPHTLALQLNFVRRNFSGPATFTVLTSKLGRRTSTVHISVSQGNPDQTLPSVVGYLTQSNFVTESGMSLQTEFALSPAPFPQASMTALRHSSTEPNWSLHRRPFNNFRRAGQHVRTYLPRKGQVGPALIDQWLCFENQEQFTQESLGYVADTFPQIMETAYGKEELEREMNRLRAPSSKPSKNDESQEASTTSHGPIKSQWAHFWYPTVLLNIEFKKALPSDGVEWLFSRVRAKKIRNGRMDLEVIIMDEGGDIVALSSHVALIVGAERNMNRKGKSVQKESGSKL